MVETSSAGDWRAELDLRPQDYERASTWILSSGGMYGVSMDAWLLFAARLRTDKRVVLRVLAAWATLVVAVGVVAIVSSASLPSWVWMAALALSATVILWAATTMGNRTHVAQLERAGGMPSRPLAMPARDVLGALRYAALVATLLVQAVMAIVVWVGYPARYGLGVSVIVLTEWAAAWLLVRAALRRPVIALDDSSRALDERLRASEAGRALAVPYVCTWSVMDIVESYRGEVVAYTAVYALQAVALAAFVVSIRPRRWALAGRPRSSPWSWARAWWRPA